MTDKIKNALREFGLTNFAVDNGTSIFILTIMIMVFGITSYNRMPKEQFPESTWPTLFINTPYFGNSAADIESLITRPIEQELNSINGVKDIRSTSMQDFSVIEVSFVTGIEIEDAKIKVKDAVDKAKSELPTDLDQDPEVMDMDFSEIPIVTVNISGNYPPDELRKYAEFLQDELENINEVNKAEMQGELEREVKIEVDLLKMESMEVAFRDVQTAVSSENISMSGGEIIRNDFRRAIRVVGEFENMDEIRNLIVKAEKQRNIYLKDIATVEMGFKEQTSIARADGLPVISLNIVKRKGENLLGTSDKIKVTLDEAVTKLPDDLKITLFNDQSINTRNEVRNLENSIISGVILVILVLQFFLGLRNAAFVGLAIPLSMLLGIIWLNVTGTTINIIVLFSLILALGLLVDNAIVVVENVFRFMQEGYSGKDAAKYGAGEVALPIIASTATTLAAFVPLAFWPGIMGDFMKYFPITLMIVLSSSLFVALVINPVFTSRFMKVDEKADDKAVRKRKRNNILKGAVLMLLIAVLGHFGGAEWLRNLMGFAILISLVNWFLLRPGAFYFQNNFLPRLENFYENFITRALKIPGWIFIGTFLMLIGAFMLFGAFMPKVDYFPNADPIYVNAFIELPIGKDIEATNKMMRELEAKVDEVIKPYRGIVDAVLSQIGENTAEPQGPPDPGASPHKARLTVSFVPAQERDGVNTFEVMEKMRDALKGYPGVQIVVDKNADGPPTGKPINIEVAGEDLTKLITLSQEMVDYINNTNINGIEELKSDVKIGKPELIVNINREAARQFGVSTLDVANTLRTAVFGLEVSKFKDGEDDYPIMVRLNDNFRYDVDALMNQRITFRDPSNGRISQVPISAVADIDYTSTYSAIKRKNLDRVITIYSNIAEGYVANEVVADIQSALKKFDMPEGFTYDFTGEQQQQQEDMDFLGFAFLAAIFMIIIILVGQFNSILAPIIVFFSIVFSTIGVFLGYVVTGQTISVIFTGLGIISLAGIVVNNAIVLIDYINLLIKNKREDKNIESMDGMEKTDVLQAIIEGGKTRLRPVLLTAITSILGLIPLAVGFNINFFTLITELNPNIFIGGDNTAIWGPMAWTVIYGLVFATFLTLIVVPAMYWLAYRGKMRIKGALGIRKG